MSLLKRLTEQAQGRQSGASDAKSELELKRATYAQVTLPAVQSLEAFLQQLVAHLKLVKPQLKQTFELTGYGVFFAIPLTEWSLNVESMPSSQTMVLNWKTRVDTERAPKLALPTYDRVRTISDIFKRFHLGGIREEKRNSVGQISQATAQATGIINCRLTVHAHVDEPVVNFQFDNVDQLASVRRSLPSEVLGPDVFDRLGEFMLRENDLFVREQWVRGLKPVARAVVVAPLALEIEKPNLLLDVTADRFAKAEPSAEELEAERVAKELAHERELDFLAELKMASRYADQAVQKNLEFAEGGEFGSERDLASLKVRFDLPARGSVKSNALADAGFETNAANEDVVRARTEPSAPEAKLSSVAPIAALAVAPVPKAEAPAARLVELASAPAAVAAEKPATPSATPSKPAAPLSVNSKALEELAKTLSPEAAQKFRERLAQFKSRSE
jgi:hypothetical protein